MRRNALAIFPVILCLAALPTSAAPQDRPLPLETPAQGTIGADDVAAFGFEATTAGLLSVTVHTTSDADLYVSLTDAFGQQVATVDSDLTGHMGSEVLAAPIRVAGRYRVVVHSRGGAVAFRIVGSWLPAESMELPPDPDGVPSRALALTVGEPHSDRIDPEEGDPADWFAITLPRGGMVTVLVEAPDGDLALELYRDGAFGEAAERSDQDLEGVRGNESITARAAAGETIYFKVTPVFPAAIDYTIRVGVM